MKVGDVLVSEVGLPRIRGHQAEDIREAIEGVLRDWMFDSLPADQRMAIPLATPSDQVYAYVKLNATSFPSSQLPKNGMDCLICPGAFWSIEDLMWGTGMTISYGFDGAVPTEAADLLLGATQRLLNAPTLFAQLQKVSMHSRFVGFANSLHQLPGDLYRIDSVARSHAKSTRQAIDRYANLLPESERATFRRDLQPFEMPSALPFQIMVMQWKAQGRLTEMPVEIAGRLARPGWDQDAASDLVTKLVAPWVRARIGKEEMARGRALGVAFPRIEVEKPITFPAPRGLMIPLVFALRNASHHALRWAIGSRAKGETVDSWVRIELAHPSGSVEILNTGPRATDVGQRQTGWQRDLDYISGSGRLPWTVECLNSEQLIYSRWEEGRACWLTRLVLEDDSSNDETPD